MTTEEDRSGSLLIHTPEAAENPDLGNANMESWL
jgi:hypothetical protein